MQVNRYHIMILLMVLCGSCIDPFNPQIEEIQEVLVINGFITDRSGLHHVEISRSTPYNDPSFVPVTGCVVTVQDEKGLVVGYSETSPGVYEAYLESGFLQVGKSYTLFASTPEGNEYRSDYDSLLACPPVDHIYYELMSHETTDPDNNLHGAQFYLDVIGTSETASNFRWFLEETWEYTAPYLASYVWFGEEVLPNQADSIYRCYMTNPVKDLFSASTRYLSVNHLYRNPLHYVSNETPRLRLKYSVLVEQHSLTNQAFDYWDNLESQSGEGGGLYESQPSSTIGNIYNVNDPSEKVLGCFYATQVQQERLTLEAISEFMLPRYKCVLDTIQSLDELNANYPHYLFSISPMGFGPPYLHGEQHCFDCRMYGGKTTPPEFW